MAKNSSFDITTGCDYQEIDNALNQARKEIINRYDFKNVVAEINFEQSNNSIETVFRKRILNYIRMFGEVSGYPARQPGTT